MKWFLHKAQTVDNLYMTVCSITLTYEHEEVMVRFKLVPLLLSFYPKRSFKNSIFWTSCCIDTQIEAVSILMILK